MKRETENEENAEDTKKKQRKEAALERARSIQGAIAAWGTTDIAKKISGTLYVEDIVNAEEETRLVEHADSLPWITDLRRRVQHYGWRYRYKERSVSPSDYLGPLPDWIDFLVNRLLVVGIITEKPDQLIVNEYMPGQGIGPHIDQPQMFGPEIVTVSLLCTYPMTFKRGAETLEFFLKRRSVMRLVGDARYKWTHSIAAKKTDGTCQRSRRLSFTFRTVRR